ncbi:MAG TPA: DUF4190 domain-containing protein [Gaiellales bacterium]|jgi:uncharacterized membrane protein|nr:DUF4190 domain-containing protein [Gaiellales bacterium]
MSAGVHVSSGETSGKAIASLVLGIGGFVILPVVLSILAIVFGRSAKREIAERPGLGGAGLATAGIVLGWIGVALTVLAVLLVLLLVAASTSTNTG